jgi:hypothetical protein
MFPIVLAVAIIAGPGAYRTADRAMPAVDAQQYSFRSTVAEQPAQYGCYVPTRAVLQAAPAGSRTPPLHAGTNIQTGLERRLHDIVNTTQTILDMIPLRNVKLWSHPASIRISTRRVVITVQF